MASIEVSTNGYATQHKLIKQGKPLRVAVGEPNHQSSVWRFWVTKTDIYAAIRTVAREWKFSLHESGVWRYAEHESYTGVAGPSPLLDPDDRVIHRWERPQSDRGWIHGMTIRVPHGYLNDFQYPMSLKGVQWVSEPEPGQCVVISMGISYGQRLPFVGAGAYACLGALALGDGGAAVIVSYQEPVDQAQQEMLREAVNDAPARMLETGWAHDPRGVVSTLLWEPTPTPQLWDVCVGLVPPNALHARPGQQTPG